MNAARGGFCGLLAMVAAAGAWAGDLAPSELGPPAAAQAAARALVGQQQQQLQASVFQAGSGNSANLIQTGLDNQALVQQRGQQNEAGTTRNEPAQLCVSEAIESAVAHLVAQGIQAGNWALQDQAEMANPVLKRYLSAGRTPPGAPRTAAAVQDRHVADAASGSTL